MLSFIWPNTHPRSHNIRCAKRVLPPGSRRGAPCGARTRRISANPSAILQGDASAAFWQWLPSWPEDTAATSISLHSTQSHMEKADRQMDGRMGGHTDRLTDLPPLHMCLLGFLHSSETPNFLTRPLTTRAALDLFLSDLTIFSLSKDYLLNLITVQAKMKSVLACTC